MSTHFDGCSAMSGLIHFLGLIRYRIQWHDFSRTSPSSGSSCRSQQAGASAPTDVSDMGQLEERAGSPI